MAFRIFAPAPATGRCPTTATRGPSTHGSPFGDTGFVQAGAAVIAAGGFVMNPVMVAEYTPALGAKLITLGSTYDDGLGIRLGMSAGADLRHMDEPFITAPFYPPPVLVTGLIVNSRGMRFVAEDSYHARTSQFVMEQAGSAAYLIVDSAHVEQPQMPLVPVLDGYETVAEMEAGLGMPAGSLEKTLARYNHHAALGEDPDFHKSSDWLAPQDQGPARRRVILRPTGRQARGSAPASSWAPRAVVACGDDRVLELPAQSGS